MDDDETASVGEEPGLCGYTRELLPAFDSFSQPEADMYSMKIDPK